MAFTIIVVCDITFTAVSREHVLIANTDARVETGSVQVGPAASHGGFISTVAVFQIINGCATVLRVLGAGGARRVSGVVSDAWCSCWGAVMCRTIAAGSGNPSTSTRTIVFIDITPDPVKSPPLPIPPRPLPR